YVFATPNDPDCSYHDGPSMSRHLGVDPPASSEGIRLQFHRFEFGSRSEKDTSQPLSIDRKDSESLAKHAGLVPAAGMRRTQNSIPRSCGYRGSLVGHLAGS